MWDTEKSDDSTLPLYVAAAILEGQQWLQDQQYREGLTHADNHGWSWTLSARLAGRYFAVAITFPDIWRGSPGLPAYLGLYSQTLE